MWDVSMMNEFTKHYIKLTPGKIEYDVYLILNVKFLKKKKTDTETIYPNGTKAMITPDVFLFYLAYIFIL